MSQSQKTTLYSLIALTSGMLMLSFASVPLYRIFCQVTGYGGTTQVANHMPSRIADRPMTIRFNADTHRDLPWKFETEQTSITLKPGESGLAFYRATNTSDKPVTGIATYNVTPLKAGLYFNKLECFCFFNQVLHPGETMHLPVTFFIDPSLADDPLLKGVDTITLSYTFFKSHQSNIVAQPHTRRQLS
jgi:cytochrome c oxidase assembly protein subunit 11